MFVRESLLLGFSHRQQVERLLLRRAAQAWALTLGRDYVVPDDVKRLAVPVLAHRIVIDSASYGLVRIHESDALIEELLRNATVPL